MNRFALVMVLFPFVLYACGDDDSGGGGTPKKDAGADSGKDGGGGSGGSTGGTGGVAIGGGTGGVAGSTGGVAGATGGSAGVAGSGGAAGTAGSAGAAGAGGTAGQGGTAGSDASTGGAAGGDGGIIIDGGAQGDTCVSPFVVSALPYTANGTTVGATADYGYAMNACPPEVDPAGAGAPDQVHAFTPTVAGKYAVTLTGTNFDSALYVVTDCQNINTTCLVGDEDICSNCTESLVIDATAGTTYFLIVDGWQTAPPATGGAYTLTVDAVVAPPNDLCSGAIAVNTVPFQHSGDTTGAAPDYGFPANSCPGVPSALGSGANDVVYSFTPTTSGSYVLSVETTGFDAALYVATDCAMVGATCLGASDSCASNCTELRTLNATAGTTYYIFVDGWATTPDPGNSGTYTLKVETPPPGDTCAAAIPVTAVPFTAAGNTLGAGSDYGYSAGVCPPEVDGWGAGSSDVVYSFTPALSGSYTITLAGFDSTVYVVTNCADVDNTCVAGTEAPCGSTCDEILTTNLTAGTTYFIIVDGYSNFGNITGAYQLDIILNP
jgi:hypothetical protein